jgi:hypothetical protein
VSSLLMSSSTNARMGRGSRAAAAVIALLVLASLTAACGRQVIGPSPPVQVTGGTSSAATLPPAVTVGGLSGVAGRLLMEGGPITVSPQSRQSPRPWPNKTVWVIAAKGSAVATARSGSSGWFTLALDPGAYRLRTADARSVRFVVRAGKVTRLTIIIPVP